MVILVTGIVWISGVVDLQNFVMYHASMYMYDIELIWELTTKYLVECCAVEM